MTQNSKFLIFLSALIIMSVGLILFVLAYKKYLPKSKHGTAKILSIGFLIVIVGAFEGLIFDDVGMGAKIIACGIFFGVIGGAVTAFLNKK